MCTDVCALNPSCPYNPQNRLSATGSCAEGTSLHKLQKTRDDDKPKVFYSVMYERQNIIADVLGLGSKVLRDISMWRNKIVCSPRK